MALARANAPCIICHMCHATWLSKTAFCSQIFSVPLGRDRHRLRSGFNNLSVMLRSARLMKAACRVLYENRNDRKTLFISMQLFVQKV